jgi:hypothetical protein
VTSSRWSGSPPAASRLRLRPPSGPGRCGPGWSPGPQDGSGPLPGRPSARLSPPWLPALPQGHGGGDRGSGGPVAAPAGDRGCGGRRRAGQAVDVAAGRGAGRGSWRACRGRAAAGRTAGRRAGRPRIDGPCPARVRGLRPDRQAAVPQRHRRGVPAVPGLAAGRSLHGLRQGQARGRPRRCRRAGLRGVLPPRPRTSPGLRDLRQDRAGRRPRTRRQAGHLRQLLSAPRGGLQRMRPGTALPARQHRPAGLQAVRSAGHRGLRPLRSGAPAASPLARGTGLRYLLHRRTAPPRPLRPLRPDTAAGQPARSGRRHLCQLCRAARRQRVRRLRHRGQDVRETPLRPVQPAAPRRDAAISRDRACPGHPGRGARGDQRGTDSRRRAELAAHWGRGRHPRRPGRRAARRHPRGAR